MSLLPARSGANRSVSVLLARDGANRSVSLLPARDGASRSVSLPLAREGASLTPSEELLDLVSGELRGVGDTTVLEPRRSELRRDVESRGTEMTGARGVETLGRDAETLGPRGAEMLGRDAEMLARGAETLGARGAEILGRDAEMLARGAETLGARGAEMLGARAAPPLEGLEPPPVEILLDALKARHGASTIARANDISRGYPGRLLEARMATSRDPRGSPARRPPRRLSAGTAHGRR